MIELQLEEYRRQSDLIWPAWDERPMPKLFDQSENIDVALKYCEHRRVVIQAGGHVGHWPRLLSPLFDWVYTFEPDLTNFRALILNTLENKNITPMFGALGHERGTGKIVYDEINCAAGFIRDGGEAPIMRVDDLKLEHCDLLYLDVEGAEFDALRGAKNTIERCKPIIGLEYKDLGKRYGVEDKSIPIKWLSRLAGYEMVERTNKDLILKANSAPARKTMQD